MAAVASRGGVSLSLMLPIIFASLEATIDGTLEMPERLSVLSLSTRNADVMLVSLEKARNEASALLARLLRGTLTTWHVPDGRLHSRVLANAIQGKQSVLIGADPTTPLEDVPKLIHATGLGGHCVFWLFVRPYSEIFSHALSSWPPLLACQMVGLIAPNDTVIQKAFWPHTPFAVPNSQWRGFLLGTETHRAGSELLTGQKLRVACAKGHFYGHNQDTCHHPTAWTIFRLLKEKNVSVDLHRVSSTAAMVRGTYSHSFDVAYILALMHDEELFAFDFPYIVLDHETFFSRRSAHRTVTLWEVGWESWRLVAATVVLLGLVAATQILATEGVRPSAHRAAGTVTLLLAAVLATSATEPAGTRRGRFIRKALFGLWFLAILPLSAYFRSELTSIVTLRRPADRIDTVEKLEDALDRGAMAPCAYVNTAAYVQIMENRDTVAQGSLLYKLRAAVVLHGREKLSTRSYLDCLSCAHRYDRVCYTTLEQPCAMREKFPGVREFRQPFKILLSGLRVRKSLPMYGPLRRFFLASKEGKLFAPNEAECRYIAETGTFEFDLNSLLMQHAVLQVASSIVLVVEILVMWCSRFTKRFAHAYN